MFKQDDDIDKIIKFKKYIIHEIFLYLVGGKNEIVDSSIFKTLQLMMKYNEYESYDPEYIKNEFNPNVTVRKVLTHKNFKVVDYIKEHDKIKAETQKNTKSNEYDFENSDNRRKKWLYYLLSIENILTHLRIINTESRGIAKHLFEQDAYNDYLFKFLSQHVSDNEYERREWNNMKGLEILKIIDSINTSVINIHYNLYNILEQIDVNSLYIEAIKAYNLDLERIRTEIESNLKEMNKSKNDDDSDDLLSNLSNQFDIDYKSSHEENIKEKFQQQFESIKKKYTVATDVKRGNRVYEFMEEYIDGFKYLIKTRNSMIDEDEASAFIELFDLPSNGKTDAEKKRYKLIRDLYFIAVGFIELNKASSLKRKVI